MAWKKFWKKGSKKSSSMVKRAKGNYTAARTGKDIASQVVKVPMTFPVQIIATTSSAYDNVYPISILQVLGANNMFATFAKLYDQVRITGARIKIQQVQGNVTYQNANNPLQIITAWDRNGVSTNGDGTPISVSFDDVKRYGSCMMKMSPYGSYYSTTRAIYPSSMNEKAQLLSTTELIKLATPPDTGFAEIFKEGTVAFNPTLYLGIRSPVGVPAGSTVNIASFTAEISISCEFRGVRYLN